MRDYSLRFFSMYSAISDFFQRSLRPIFIDLGKSGFSFIQRYIVPLLTWKIFDKSFCDNISSIIVYPCTLQYFISHFCALYNFFRKCIIGYCNVQEAMIVFNTAKKGPNE